MTQLSNAQSNKNQVQATGVTGDPPPNIVQRRFSQPNITANNANYLGGTAASGYQTTAGLSANVATLTANNSSYLGGTPAAGYQTTAGLASARIREPSFLVC